MVSDFVPEHLSLNIRLVSCNAAAANLFTFRCALLHASVVPDLGEYSRAIHSWSPLGVTLSSPSLWP